MGHKFERDIAVYVIFIKWKRYRFGQRIFNVISGELTVIKYDSCNSNHPSSSDPEDKRRRSVIMFTATFSLLVFV